MQKKEEKTTFKYVNIIIKLPFTNRKNRTEISLKLFSTNVMDWITGKDISSTNCHLWQRNDNEKKII